MKKSNLSTHTFVDASKTASAECIFLRSEFRVNEIRWKFNPPFSPWWGGGPIQRLYPLELTPNYEQVVPETQKDPEVVTEYPELNIDSNETVPVSPLP
ncbi:hypothetical protein CEXT_733971 [Caerostris extrusa]|uniref:Uncharacterized protein n=1 Tax=Caerostris extrusa TaxID=172846 RepID=A0AAV4WPB2_CAEEX|nr:hypothetical protein CEXT_733971 [Caerostris extrusa]